jgi:hypothetical protein
MNCADISERLIDHLYGELAEGDRLAFDTHVGGCESCRREVRGLDRTLGRARTALRGPLSEEPPPRVRRAVLEAAAAAVGARAEVGRVEPERAEAPGRKKASGVGRDEESAHGGVKTFWAWLRRPWFLPAFAAVSALAIFFMSRKAIEQSPERFLTEARAPAPAPAPAKEDFGVAADDLAAAAPAAQAFASHEAEEQHKGQAPASASLEKKKVASRQRLALERLEARGQEPPARRAATKPARARAEDGRWAVPPPPAKKKAALDEGVPSDFGGGSIPGGTAGTARGDEARMAAQAPARDQPEAAAPGRAATAAAAKPSTSSAPGSASPPPAAAPRPAAAPPPAPALPPSPPRPPSRSRGAPSAAEAAPATEAVAEPTRAPAEADREAKPEPSPSLADLVRRADRLYTDGRWAEAAAAYRELLRRFPSHEDVAVWKRRLEAATRASAQP